MSDIGDMYVTNPLVESRDESKLLKEIVGQEHKVRQKKPQPEIQNESFYPTMYNTEDVIPITPPKATKQLGGLKLSGSHIQKLVLGDQQVDIPSVNYVKLLEEQVKDLRRELRETQSELKRTARIQNKLIEVINKLRTDLDNKVDMRY